MQDAVAALYTLLSLLISSEKNLSIGFYNASEIRKQILTNDTKVKTDFDRFFKVMLVLFYKFLYMYSIF